MKTPLKQKSTPQKAVHDAYNQVRAYAQASAELHKKAAEAGVDLDAAPDDLRCYGNTVSLRAYEMNQARIAADAHHEKEDPISPSHYKFPSGVESIQIARYLSFGLGNSLKYICRAGRKAGSPALEDLRKALWYLNDEIARLENQ